MPILRRTAINKIIHTYTITVHIDTTHQKTHVKDNKETSKRSKHLDRTICRQPHSTQRTRMPYSYYTGGRTLLTQEVAGTRDSFLAQIEQFGIRPSAVHRNLCAKDLMHQTVKRNEGVICSTGSITVNTGKYTGRSPDDRYIVDDATTHDTVDWGKINHPFPSDKFDELFARIKEHTNEKELFVFDGFSGADPAHRLPLRVINDRAWQSLFSSCMFIRPTQEELDAHRPDLTIMCINDFESVPERDGTASNVFIIINLAKKIVIIGGTKYAGEIKKSVFAVMNYILPSRGVFPMHCSANIGRQNNDTALFFGLSGTGKTTLSADPARMLIGDDEHGWSESGTFNFEGGCYAKCINLSREAEPEIWDAIRPGAVLENVVLGSGNVPDYNDNALTENTRAAYPLEHIPGAKIPSIGGNPKVIIFLTADALGVLPPVSRLTADGAMYHFMSGYTSKLAGTERGIKEPKSVFSECFGAPFMPRPASVYAKMLGERIARHKSSVYLINTGWSGGHYGVGRRISISHSRAMVTAAITGTINEGRYVHNDVFNLDVPSTVPGVPADILDPRSTWENKESYDATADKLARMFAENFSKFTGVPSNIAHAGPTPAESP